MKKIILFIFLYAYIFIAGYAQRIVKSAIDQYPSFNNGHYSFSNDHYFQHTFTLSDGSIVTLSANQPNIFITKWSKDLTLLDKVATSNIKNQAANEAFFIQNYNNYYSFMFNDIIYLFAFKMEDDVVTYYYYEISCAADKISVEIKKNNVNGIVISNQGQYVYMMNSEKAAILKIDMLTLKSELVQIDVQNVKSKLLIYHNVKGYLILTYRTKSTAKGKEPSNSVVETFILETKTGKINKISIEFLLDRTDMTDIDVAVNNDSIYFITYSNKEKTGTLKYKIIGYDVSLNKPFLEKSSILEFSKKYYHKYLMTLFFGIDSKSGNIVLILDRFMRDVMGTSTMSTKSDSDFDGVPINGSCMPLMGAHVDYPIIYMSPQGDLLNTNFIYWLKGGSESQSYASYYPKILVVDGLVYLFISSYRMVKMTCYIYNSDGTLKDQVVLFDKDIPDTHNVNTATITYMGNGLFVFATIPNQMGKTGSYYMFKVYK